MINFDLIFDELQAMHSNGVKFYKNLTLEELQELNDFLEDNKYDLGIEIKPHRESKSGNRNIDMIIVKKL